MKRTGLLLTIMGSIILLLVVVQMSISNMLSTGGIKLSDIQDEIQSQERQNAILKEKILSISSLTTISQEAQQQGFVPDNSQAMVVSHTQPPIALNQ